MSAIPPGYYAPYRDPTLCPICEIAPFQQFETHRTGKTLSCDNCGTYFATTEVLKYFAAEGRSLHERAVLSRAIFRMNARGRSPSLDTNLVAQIIKFNSLPSPMEQLDLLVENVAHWSIDAGHGVVRQPAHICAALGSKTVESAKWVTDAAVEAGLLDWGPVHVPGGPRGLRLTLAGWKRLQELRTQASDNRRAFMAMPFGDDELNAVFSAHFKKAAARAGFDLNRLDEGASAGLIDARLRVEIRKCRFLIADLTHGNNGAYWEAGFAEGIGREVIYTCRKDVFSNKEKKPHFDTNHHQTVVWDPRNLQAAEDELAATIRATLPAEAKLDDD